MGTGAHIQRVYTQKRRYLPHSSAIMTGECEKAAENYYFANCRTILLVRFFRARTSIRVSLQTRQRWLEA